MNVFTSTQMKFDDLKIVHACGVPGSGKSTYCEWLERQKSFLHLDFDQLLRGHGDQSKLSLTDALRTGSSAFLSEITKIGRSAAIDWGFPLISLPLVRELQSKGVETWWFDGDRKAARKAFKDRGTVSLADFDAQMASIQSNWVQIQEVIGNHIIETITPGPTHAKPEWIFEQMFGKNRPETQNT